MGEKRRVLDENIFAAIAATFDDENAQFWVDVGKAGGYDKTEDAAC